MTIWTWPYHTWRTKSRSTETIRSLSWESDSWSFGFITSIDIDLEDFQVFPVLSDVTPCCYILHTRILTQLGFCPTTKSFELSEIYSWKFQLGFCRLLTNDHLAIMYEGVVGRAHPITSQDIQWKFQWYIPFLILRILSKASIRGFL